MARDPGGDGWRVVAESADARLAYDAALRREELCLLETDDLDPAHRTIMIRAQKTKSRRSRVVPYSAVSGQLLAGYLRHRRAITTDLARSGWELHQIATFAGHRSTDTTQRYIHLSGRDLAERLASGMSQIHQARIAQLGEVLS